MLRKSFRILGAMAIALSITACGSKATSSTVTSTDLDAIVAQKVQEQLEIDRRVKESVAAATQEITTTASNTETSTEASSASTISTEASKNSGTYLLPFSNERLVTDANLATLSKDQLRLARNEIFARHGRMYETKDLNDYFSSQGWYTPSIPADQFRESVLSKIESDNIARISAYEKSGSVESKPMQLRTGSYDGGLKTYSITIQPGAEVGILMHSDEMDPSGRGMAVMEDGYLTPNDDGTYTEWIQQYPGSDAPEHIGQTFRMVSNGFKDTQTGEYYEYSPY